MLWWNVDMALKLLLCCKGRQTSFPNLRQALPEGADGSGSKRKWYDDQKKKRAEELKRMGLEPDQVAHPVPALTLALHQSLTALCTCHAQRWGCRRRVCEGEVKQTG